MIINLIASTASTIILTAQQDPDIAIYSSSQLFDSDVTDQIRGKNLKRKVAVSTALVVAFGALAVGVLTPTMASANSPVGYAFRGLNGKCMDVAGGIIADGNSVQLYACNGTGAQYWNVQPGSFEPEDGDFITMAGKCLDAENGGTWNGTRVQLYNCNGTPAQRWIFDKNSLRNVGANRCLDVKDWSSANGTPLQLWSCTNGANQLWYRERVAPPDMMP